MARFDFWTHGVAAILQPTTGLQARKTRRIAPTSAPLHGAVARFF